MDQATESIVIPQVNASDLNPPSYMPSDELDSFTKGYATQEVPSTQASSSTPDDSSLPSDALDTYTKNIDKKTTRTADGKLPSTQGAVSTAEDFAGPSPKAAAAARAETATGLGDAPRSISKVAATIAPSTFNSVVNAAVPAYAALTGQPQLSPEESSAMNSGDSSKVYLNALQQREAEYQNQYGADPHQQGNRLVGQVLAAGPVLGAVGRVAGAAAKGVSAILPDTAGPAVDFLGGNTASNAIVDPISGAVTKAATFGNKLMQYGSSGANAALQAVPLTALTAAGSSTPMSTQLGQNMAVGGVFGAAAPAALDSGIGVGNFFKRIVSPATDAVSQKAENVLQQTAGGLPTQMDTTEYVKGAYPTTAQAAAAGGDANASNLAAVERVISQAKPGTEQLTSPIIGEMNAAQDTAHRNAVLELTGTPQDVADIRNAKLADASSLMGNEAQRAIDPSLPQGTVWANAGQTDTSGVLAAIKRMQQGPASGNAELQRHLSAIQELLQDSRASDPQFVYESIVKPNVIDIANSDPFKANSAGKSTIKYLQALKPALDDTIQNAAPGYAPYRQAYASASAQGDRLEALQSLGLVNPEAATGPASIPTLNNVNKALGKIAKNVNNTDPANKFQHITSDDINALQNLQKSLVRQQAPERLLKVPGSPTSQNTRLTENLTNALGLGEPTGLRKILNAPNILGTVGGALGGSVGSHLGPWGTMAGTEMGGAAGLSLGKIVQSGKHAAASQTVNKLVDLMSNPENVKAYQEGQSIGGSMLRNVGEMPKLQRFLGQAAPLAALGYNKTNTLPLASGQ